MEEDPERKGKLPGGTGHPPQEPEQGGKAQVVHFLAGGEPGVFDVPCQGVDASEKGGKPADGRERFFLETGQRSVQVVQKTDHPDCEGDKDDHAYGGQGDQYFLECCHALLPCGGLREARECLRPFSTIKDEKSKMTGFRERIR